MNWNPSWDIGVKGGAVGGVVVLTAMLAEPSLKLPRKFTPLLKARGVEHFQVILSELRAAPTNPIGCALFKLFATVKASKTEQTFSR